MWGTIRYVAHSGCSNVWGTMTHSLAWEDNFGLVVRVVVQHSGQSGRVQFLVNHDITFLSDASSYGTCVYFQGCHRACRVRNH